MSRSDNFERFAATNALSSDLKRRSVLGALVTGAGGASVFVLRLGSTLILLRLLVPEPFGLVAMVTAITRIAERFAALGLFTATVQAPEINDVSAPTCSGSTSPPALHLPDSSPCWRLR